MLVRLERHPIPNAARRDAAHDPDAVDSARLLVWGQRQPRIAQRDDDLAQRSATGTRSAQLRLRERSRIGAGRYVLAEGA